MSAIDVDQTQFPLVQITMDGRQTDEDVDQFIDVLLELANRGEEAWILNEIRKFDTNLAHVKRIAHAANEHVEVQEKLLKGMVMVTTNGAFRFALSSFLLIARLPFPHKVVETREEGIAFLKSQGLP